MHLLQLSAVWSIASLSSALLVFLILVLGIVRGIQHSLRNRDNKRFAPQAKTLIPWLGGALDYIRNSPQFILRCVQSYGRDFRVTVGGKQMVFLSDSKALHAMFRNRDHFLAFGHLRNLMPRVLGGVQSDDCVRVLEQQLIPVVIQGNSDPSIEEIGSAFNSEIYSRLMVPQLVSSSSGPGLSLKQFIANTVTPSICLAIFGSSFPLHILQDLAVLDEKSYYLSLNLPFLPSSIYRARQRSQEILSGFIKQFNAAVDSGSPPACTAHAKVVVRALGESLLSDGDQAGLLIMYLFGISSNPTRLMFWLFAHLLHDHDAYRRVQEEIDRGVEEFGDLQVLLTAHPRVISGPRFRLLHSAVKEAARLHSLPGSVRVVEKDMEFPSSDEKGSFWTQTGDIIVANSLAVHMNEQLYPDAHTFRVDRYLAPQLSSHFYLWGKGEHICPGRHLAYYMMKMFTIICLRHFDMILLEGPSARLPSDNPHSLTLTRPTEDVLFTLKPRTTLRGSKAGST